jgi:hypothetical protein
LGVLGGNFDAEADDLLPAPLPEVLDFDASYYGDYLVCPLTPEVPGTMRDVCIDSVKGLTVR